MFCKSFLFYTVLATLYSTVSAFPALSGRDDQGSSSTRSLSDSVGQYPQLDLLEQGNAKFRDDIAKSDQPDLLWNQTVNGQHPEYLFIGCSDSRVSEGTIFSSPPGILFTERNIANQYLAGDLNVVASVAYSVTTLGVGHIVIMGHYGCGGVQASILNRPDNLDRAGEAVQSWIDPIRALYHNSTRDEIVKLREYRAANPNAEAPKFEDPGFRALVEENVKSTVYSVANDTILADHWQAFLAEQKSDSQPSTPLRPVYIHGFVYDISDGQIYDLNVSQGPPGYEADYSKCKRNLIAAYRHGSSSSSVEGC